MGKRQRLRPGISTSSGCWADFRQTGKALYRSKSVLMNCRTSAKASDVSSRSFQVGNHQEAPQSDSTSPLTPAIDWAPRTTDLASADALYTIAVELASDGTVPGRHEIGEPFDRLRTTIEAGYSRAEDVAANLSTIDPAPSFDIVGGGPFRVTTR